MRHIEEFEKCYPDLEMFVLVLQGSQNYGLDIYTDEYKSDIDTKVIVIPSLEDVVMNKKPISTTHVLPNNEHLDNKDIVQLKSDKKGQLQYANQYTDDSGNLYTLREINRNDFNDTVKDFFQLDGTRFKDPNVFIKYAVLSEVKKYIHDNIDKNPIHFGEKRANEIKTIFDKINILI